MGYDEVLADRVREVLRDEPGLSEKAMFGGLAFLLDGHMALAVGSDGGLLLRVDPAAAHSLVDGDLVSRFVMRGRQMNGWLDVRPEAVAGDEELREWAQHGVDFVRALPPK